MKNFTVILSVLALSFLGCKQQQKIDESFIPNIQKPMYGLGEGPLILIDESHNNFHTKDGLYKPFSELMLADGYNVESLTLLTEENLERAKILVISNAMPENYKKNTSAFKDEGVKLIEKWVKSGGSLLFIADHMPCPEASIKLSKAFDLKFYNCYALDTTKNDFDYFSTQNGTLLNCIITQGRDQSEIVNSVVSFTGQAFDIPNHAVPVLKFASNYVMAFPKRPWQFDEQTKYESIANQVQGAILQHEEGRVAVFGEAAMFTAQISGNGIPVGFTFPKAEQNEQFALNIIHWLDGKLD